MRILCFGDSNTYGFNPCTRPGSRYDREHRFTDLLADQTGWDVVNAGVNGRGVPRRDFEISQVKELILGASPFDLFLLMLGTNDLLEGMDAAGVCACMRSFLTQILPCCPKVLLVAPHPVKRGTWVLDDRLLEESRKLAEAYRSLAEDLHLSFIDTSGWNLKLTYDGVHFSADDHRLFASRLADAAARLRT